jgi:hypothetical protein
MKNILTSLIFSAILGQLIGCSRPKDSYVTLIDYEDRTNRLEGHRLLSKDSLFIFFEEHFNGDTVDIAFGQDKRRIRLKTDPSTGVSKLETFGNIKDNDKFTISLNGRQEQIILIKNTSMNKWAVNFWNDTLKITVLKFAPFYD